MTPPITPAVPASIVRRNTERGRTGLLSHRLSSKIFWFEPAAAAADRCHSTGAAWNWHPFAVGNTRLKVLQSIAIAGRDRRFESGFLQRRVCEPSVPQQRIG